jgi:hypothetical protein
MRQVVFTVALVLFCGYAYGQKQIKSNAEFYQDEAYQHHVRHALIVFPVDFFFGKYGLHYEIQANDFLHFDIEAGALGSNYKGDMLLRPIEPLNNNSLQNMSGYYFSGAIIFDKLKGTLGNYWGLGVMSGYRYYASGDEEFTQSIILSLFFKFQHPISEHIFFQANASIGFENIEQTYVKPQLNRYHMELRGYYPINVGLGYLF